MRVTGLECAIFNAYQWVGVTLVNSKNTKLSFLPFNPQNSQETHSYRVLGAWGVNECVQRVKGWVFMGEGRLRALPTLLKSSRRLVLFRRTSGTNYSLVQRVSRTYYY